MKTQRKKQLLISYVIGVLLTIAGVYGLKDFNIYLISLGGLFVIVPWVLCLLDATKKKEDGLLWFFLLFFIGAIGIPVYLLNSLSNEKK